eukprot:10848857-Lingulodinium_polyedra.AAC.2
MACEDANCCVDAARSAGLVGHAFAGAATSPAAGPLLGCERGSPAGWGSVASCGRVSNTLLAHGMCRAISQHISGSFITSPHDRQRRMRPAKLVKRSRLVLPPCLRCAVPAPLLRVPDSK